MCLQVECFAETFVWSGLGTYGDPFTTLLTSEVDRTAIQRSRGQSVTGEYLPPGEVIGAVYQIDSVISYSYNPVTNSYIKRHELETILEMTQYWSWGNGIENGSVEALRETYNGAFIGRVWRDRYPFSMTSNWNWETDSHEQAVQVIGASGYFGGTSKIRVNGVDVDFVHFKYEYDNWLSEWMFEFDLFNNSLVISRDASYSDIPDSGDVSVEWDEEDEWELEQVWSGYTDL